MTAKHTQILNGQNQVNLTVAMLLNADIPFAMEPTGTRFRWTLTVPEDAKGIVQKFATVAGDIKIEGLTAPEDDSND